MSWYDTPLAIARAICGDGFGKGLKADEIMIARSAAYNKTVNAANNVLSSGVSNKIITQQEADALRKTFNEIDFSASDSISNVNEALTKVSGYASRLDGSNKQIAKDFADISEKWTKASGSEAGTLSDYAEFLGVKNNKLGIMNTASGYFLDKQHGTDRMKTIAVAGVGVGVAGRVLSGGSLTRTNTGERNIAGIPFI